MKKIMMLFFISGEEKMNEFFVSIEEKKERKFIHVCDDDKTGEA